MGWLESLKNFFLGNDRQRKRKKRRAAKLVRRKPSAKKKVNRPVKRSQPVKKKSAKKAAQKAGRRKTASSGRLRKTAPLSKVPSKKTVKPKKPSAASQPKEKSVPAPGVEAGTITHYFPRVKAAVLKVENRIAVGSRILIQGTETKQRQTVRSLQINRIPVDEGRPGEEVGLEVQGDVRPGDKVYILGAASKRAPGRKS